MLSHLTTIFDRSRPLALLILFQAACAAYFVYDITRDALGAGLSYDGLLPELLATAGLVMGILFEVRWLLGLLRKQQHMQQGLNVAAGALADLMDEYFKQWNLTAAEQDVATFVIKGYSITETAGFRGSAEATVKTHLNSIYRKAGVPGRAQLVSLLVEDLLRAPLVGGRLPQTSLHVPREPSERSGDEVT